MCKKRSLGDGGIDRRGDDIYRLRYRTKGKRHSKAFHGTLTEARAELRKILRTADTGDKITLGQWIAAGAPGRRKKKVSARTLEGGTEDRAQQANFSRSMITFSRCCLPNGRSTCDSTARRSICHWSSCRKTP
jgi:hypothetical protein